jgi:hypothetical protein
MFNGKWFACFGSNPYRGESNADGFGSAHPPDPESGRAELLMLHTFLLKEKVREGLAPYFEPNEQ